MAKTEDEKLKERLEEIQNLMKQRVEIDSRLKELTGVRVPQKETGKAKPEGFILTVAIKESLANTAPASLNIKEIHSKIGQKYSFFPEIKNIRATAKYLVKQDELKYDSFTKSYTINPEKLGQIEGKKKTIQEILQDEDQK